jgi:hypothetical protein
MLLAGFSTQLTQPQPHEPGQHPLLEAAMAHAASAPRLVQALLRHYTTRAPAPARIPLYDAAASPGMLRSALLAPVTYAASLLVGGAGGGGGGGAAPAAAAVAAARGPPAPLADAAGLVLLVLVHHAQEGCANPFRGALCDACDDDARPAGSAAAGAGSEGGAPADPERALGGSGAETAVSFSRLYQALCTGLARRSEASVLLLYSCLHGNVAFRDALLTRPDLDALLLPLLALLYDAHAPGRPPNGTYMLLIILLILTQDAAFHAAAHALVLRGVPWYRERVLRRISCGSLLVLLLARCVASALASPGGGDVYLHTNCLAALANCAPHCASLSGVAAQRLVSLFHALARRAERLAAASHADADVFADLARLELEVLNATLTHALPRNPELVYALLQRPDVFTPWRGHARLGDLTENVMAVIDWFSARLDAEQGGGAEQAAAAAAAHAPGLPVVGGAPPPPAALLPPPPRVWSAGAALERVRAHALAWRSDSLRLFEQLRFTYEEEACPEEFFVPYVWRLIVDARAPSVWHDASLVLLTSADGDEPPMAQGARESGAASAGAALAVDVRA